MLGVSPQPFAQKSGVKRFPIEVTLSPGEEVRRGPEPIERVPHTALALAMAASSAATWGTASSEGDATA